MTGHRAASWPAARPILAVSFDATNTLFACPHLAQLYSEVLHRHGHEIAPGQISEQFPLVVQELDCRVPTGRDRFAAHPRGARGYWRDVLTRLGDYLDFSPSPFAAAELFERFAHAEAWQVFPEVPAVLGELRGRGLLLAVTSNWDERLPGLLAQLDLAPYFDRVILSSEIGAPKPHPAIFERLVEELEVDPAATLHVGDNKLEDGEGAVAAGLQALVLDRSAGDTLERVSKVLVQRVSDVG